MHCQQALTAPRAGVWGIGTAGRCLSKTLAEGQYMAQGCKNLVIAAAPKVGQVKLGCTVSLLCAGLCLYAGTHLQMMFMSQRPYTHFISVPLVA